MPFDAFDPRLYTEPMLEAKATKAMSFESAVDHVKLIRSMKDDLPDGQWDSLKEELLDSFGTAEGKVDLIAAKANKDVFIKIVQDNMSYWA